MFQYFILDPEACPDQDLGPQSLQRSASAMCIIKDLSLPSSLRLIAAAFVFVQCLQQARAAAATKAADAAADAPMAFSMSTGRSPRCHLAFEPWGEIKAYQIVIKLHKTETVRLGNDLGFNSAAKSSLLGAWMCRFVAEKDVSSLLGFH